MIWKLQRICNVNSEDHNKIISNYSCNTSIYKYRSALSTSILILI